MLPCGAPVETTATAPGWFFCDFAKIEFIERVNDDHIILFPAGAAAADVNEVRPVDAVSAQVPKVDVWQHSLYGFLWQFQRLADVMEPVFC